MEMTVFEIPHKNTAENHGRSYIVICNKNTISKFTTKEYDYGFARIEIKFKHDKDSNELDVQFALLQKKKKETVNVYVHCEETNYTKRHIIPATYNIGKVRYDASFGNELIFCINIAVCKANEKKLVMKIAEDRDFNFVISATDEGSVVVHKLWILNDKALVKDLATKGVTLKCLIGKISNDKKESKIEINENDIFGNPVSWTAVLDYIAEKRVPELASAILKKTPGFVVYSYVADRNSRKSNVNAELTDDNSASESFVVIHQNVQSYKDKISRINALNRAQEPDVLALSEVFSRKAEIETITLSGYVLAHCNCRTSVAHGGAAIYVRDGMQYTRRDDLQSIAEQVHFEITAIEISDIELIAIALYRTGNGKFTTYLIKLDVLLDKLSDEGKRFLIVGDHNVHEITDDNFKRRQRRKVEYVINSYGCINTVKFPTRGDASLDCGIANHARNDLIVTAVDGNISDHTAQYYVFTTDNWGLKNNTFESIETRLLADGAIHLLYHDIDSNIKTVTENLNAGKIDVNKAFDELFKILSHYVDFHFPVSNKNAVPCMDEEMKNYILECKHFLEVKLNYPDDTVVSNSITDLIFESRQKLIIKRLELSLPELDIWKTHGVQPTEIFQPDPLKYVKRNNAQIPNNAKGDVAEFVFPIVTHELLQKTLLTLLELRDKGDITVTLLYCLWPAITKCLVVLMNKTFENGLYPDVLKTNSNSQLNMKENENHYKQITIAPIICETVETFIAQTIKSYLDENDFLADKHYSDGPIVAATMTSESIFHLVATGLDDKLKVAGIFSDLSTAFNMISHKHLLNKLHGVGIKNNALSLVQTFLQGSGNGVQSNTSEDNNLNGNSGLPQGSVLGDALFLLYVNDISTSIDIGRCVLAPDARTAVIILSEDSYNDLKNVIDRVFNQLRSWLERCDLPNMNVEIMNFSARVVKNPPLDDYSLCENYELFGLTFDANLSFKMHVDKLCDKLSSAVFALRKVRPLISLEALRHLYYKYFHMPMSYGILVWGNSVDSVNVLGIQIRALRTLEGVPADHVDTKGLFRKHRILTLYSQYLFELLTFTRVNNLTRQGHRLKIALNNPNVGGPEVFEKLPAALKTEEIEAFNSNVKELLLDNPLYSVEDFTKVMKIINVNN